MRSARGAVARHALLVAGIALGASATACEALRPVTASDDDLADYRAFRVAAHEGRRLAFAQHYLAAHPRGAWAAEVRAAFDREEPAYFEASKASRTRARDYLVDLPRGPHAAAAVALLTAFDTTFEDIATARLLREARRTEASLDRASAGRRAVGERLLGWLAALLDPAAYGVGLADVPPPLRAALEGEARVTWGSLPAEREEDLFFALPARLTLESRVLTALVAVTIRDGVVREGRIEGQDLFVHWDEADELIARDPTSEADRAAAADHVRDVLSGALEARLPADRCAASGGLLARECDGWRVRVTASRAGTPDAIDVRAPRPATPRESGRTSSK